MTPAVTTRFQSNYQIKERINCLNSNLVDWKKMGFCKELFSFRLGCTTFSSRMIRRTQEESASKAGKKGRRGG